MAMKSAWASHNDDGVGIYWRDLVKTTNGKTMHLARFQFSKDLARVPNDYDRLLIHFRSATKGLGTHPFTCRDKPALNSQNWLLIHNGAVDDAKARKILGKAGHKFSTTIDSEAFVHVWGELTEKDLLQRAKAFAKRVEELDLTGWANLVFYNVVTDEYVAFTDNALRVIQNKARTVTVICSDDAWLDTDKAKKQGIHNDELAFGQVVYGKGNEFKTKKNVWGIQQRTAYIPPQECTTQTFFSDRPSLPMGRNDSTSELGDARRQAARDFDKFWNGGLSPDDMDYSRYGNPNNDHYYTPSRLIDADTGEEYCRICFLGKAFHTMDDEQDKREEAEAKTKPPTGSNQIANAPVYLKKAETQVSGGYVKLKLTSQCFCNPFTNPPRMCQGHWQMGFRYFSDDGKWVMKEISSLKHTAPSTQGNALRDEGLGE
jgi:predicted glutamine amidotransferase